MTRPIADVDPGVDVLLMTVNFGVELMQEPYGIAMLSSLLTARGIRTSLLEPGVDALSWQACLDVIREQRPRILGISLLFDAAITATTELVHAARRALPGLHVFIGGQAVTTGYRLPAYDALVRACDAIFVGEAELGAPEYVSRVLDGRPWRELPGVAYHDADRGLVSNPPAPRMEDLDRMPPPDRAVLRQIMRKHPRYRTAAVQVGRGCASSCSFCSYGTLTRIQDGQRKLRRRSFASVFDEIERLFHDLGIRDFHIEDESLFDTSAEHNRELRWFADALRSLPEPISFDVLARIDCIDSDTVAALKAAGMTRVFVGIDSVDPEDLRLYGKGYAAEVAHDGLRKLLALGYSLDVDAEFRVQTGYITWNPYSTLSRIRNAYRFFIDYGNTPKLIQHHLFVFSGTPLKKTIARDGLYVPGGVAVGRSELNFRFAHPEIERLFAAMIGYFDVWSPLRDGIRMVEKTIRVELGHAAMAIEDLVTIRRRCDAHFFTAFGEMLVEVEHDRDGPRLAELTRSAIADLETSIPPGTLQRIADLCREHDLREDLVDAIRSNPLALARYKL